MKGIALYLYLFVSVGICQAQTYTVESAPNTKLINNSYVSNPDAIITEAAVIRLMAFSHLLKRRLLPKSQWWSFNPLVMPIFLSLRNNYLTSGALVVLVRITDFTRLRSTNGSLSYRLWCGRRAD
jgi:hypothetical protein